MLNLVNYFHNTELQAFMATAITLLIFSKNKSQFGEFWCLMITSVPLVVLAAQKIIK